VRGRSGTAPSKRRQEGEHGLCLRQVERLWPFDSGDEPPAAARARPQSHGGRSLASSRPPFGQFRPSQCDCATWTLPLERLRTPAAFPLAQELHARGLDRRAPRGPAGCRTMIVSKAALLASRLLSSSAGARTRSSEGSGSRPSRERPSTALGGRMPPSAPRSATTRRTRSSRWAMTIRVLPCTSIPTRRSGASASGHAGPSTFARNEGVPGRTCAPRLRRPRQRSAPAPGTHPAAATPRRGATTIDRGEIRRRDKLGGLIHKYDRAAA
jgi:hypothetical protein